MSILHNEKKKRDLGITSTFVFEGDYNNLHYGRVYGTFINEVVKRMVEESKKKGESWLHYFTNHEIVGWSKEDLWENVKIAALQKRTTAKILVVDFDGNERIISVK